METTPMPSERKYEIGDFVSVLIGENKMKGRISRQTQILTSIHEYYIHTIIGTFFFDDDTLIEKFSENI